MNTGLVQSSIAKRQLVIKMANRKTRKPEQSMRCVVVTRQIRNLQLLVVVDDSRILSLLG
ncbi:hypothetical protein A5320_06610 [Rheinheimera sp. SA_1]|nr:hypothetical protein A5320_06610 [Rheinheimera sp. SA_1]